MIKVPEKCKELLEENTHIDVGIYAHKFGTVLDYENRPILIGPVMANSLTIVQSSSKTTDFDFGGIHMSKLSFTLENSSGYYDNFDFHNMVVNPVLYKKKYSQDVPYSINKGYFIVVDYKKMIIQLI